MLKVILLELDGVPNLGNDELKDARDRAITLELTNRFANVKGNYTSPHIIAQVLKIHQIRMPKRRLFGSKRNGESLQFSVYSLLKTWSSL